MATNNKYGFKFLTAQGQWVNDNLEVVNPYLISLSKQKRLCVKCHKPTAFRPTLDPNAAQEYCPHCGCTMAVQEAPKDMQVPRNIGNYARVQECLALPVTPLFIQNGKQMSPNQTPEPTPKPSTSPSLKLIK